MQNCECGTGEPVVHAVHVVHRVHRVHGPERKGRKGCGTQRATLPSPDDGCELRGEGPGSPARSRRRPESLLDRHRLRKLDGKLNYPSLDKRQPRDAAARIYAAGPRRTPSTLPVPTAPPRSSSGRTNRSGSAPTAGWRCAIRASAGASPAGAASLLGVGNRLCLDRHRLG